LSLRNGSTILGEGNDTILRSNAGNAIMLGGTPAIPLHDIAVEDLQIDGSQQKSGKGVYGTWVVNLTLRGLYVHDTPHTGIGPDFLTNFSITRCYVANASRLVDGNGIGVGGPSENGTISDNIIANVTRKAQFGYGILLEELRPFLRPLRNVTILNNTVVGSEGSAVAFVGAEHVRISGNHLLTTNGSGVLSYVNSDEFTPPLDLTVDGNWIEAGADGLRLEDGRTEGVRVVGNLLEATNHSLILQGSHVLARDNFGVDGGTASVIVLNASQSAFVENLLVKSVPQGSNAVLSVRDSSEIAISGNAVIDCVGGPNAGVAIQNSMAVVVAANAFPPGPGFYNEEEGIREARIRDWSGARPGPDGMQARVAGLLPRCV